MRADRLVSIMMLFQAHERLTAAEIADRLEVSERTIRRDLDLLSTTGVPLYSERGRGGGWRLVPGWRSDLSGLTADEAHALFLVAGPAAVTGLGVDDTVRSALRKLMATLPAATRSDAGEAAGTVLVDPARWGGPTVPPPPLLGEVARVLRTGRRARVRYAGRGARAAGEPARDRIVDPYGLVNKGEVWYLVVGSDGETRTLRVSRIEAVTALDEPAHRPADLDLPAVWARSRQAFEESMWSCRVRLRADPAIVPILVGLLGPRHRVQPAEPARPAGPGEPGGLGGLGGPLGPGSGTGGWPAFTALFPSPAVAATGLAGFGARVVVDDPPEVAIHLRRLAAELLGRYPPGEPTRGKDATG